MDDEKLDFGSGMENLSGFLIFMRDISSFLL